MMMTLMEIRLFFFNSFDLFGCFEFGRMCVIMVVNPYKLVVVVDVIIEQNAAVDNSKNNKSVENDSDYNKTQ